MLIYGKKVTFPGGWTKPIEAGVLDPIPYSVVYFFIYPEVFAGFMLKKDAIEYAEARRAAQPLDPGTWSIIQTDDELHYD
jgi:hypothetical protein